MKHFQLVPRNNEVYKRSKKSYTYLYLLFVPGVSERTVLRNDIAVQKAILTNTTVKVFKCKLTYILIEQCLAECTSDFNLIF